MLNKLRKNFALALIIIIGIFILYISLSFLKSIGIAIILTILIYPLYKYFYKKTKKESFSAFSVIFLIFIIIFIPVSTIAGVMINQVNNFNIDLNQITFVEKSIFEITGKHVSIKDGIKLANQKFKSQFGDIFSQVITLTSNFLISTFIVFFIMFYLLTQKNRFYKLAISLIPFSEKNADYLLKESSKITKAILIGQVLTAIVQGVLGMIAFFIAGINNAFLWGVVMIILSIIPVVGAFLVWIPAGIFLLLNNEIGMGIFVLIWGAVVISQIDNIIRPKLINKFANIHPLETFLGIFIGLSFFGLIGIIVGPLIISLFNTLIIVYKKEYLQND